MSAAMQHPASEIAGAPVRRERASPHGPAAGLNTLFQILQRIDAERLTGKLIVRREGKLVAGAWRTNAGRINSAATVYGRELLAEELTTERNVPFEQALTLARIALPADGVLSGDRLAAVGLDRTACRRVALAFTARECLQTALHCGTTEADFVRLGAPEPDAEWAFDALELFTAAAARLDLLAPDEASAIYQELADKAAAAVLLLRPTLEGQLPVPIACRGFDGATISDVLPICRAAAQLCRPEVFRTAGWMPALTMASLDDGAWVAATGAHRYVLLRVTGRRDAARVVAEAMAQFKAAAK